MRQHYCLVILSLLSGCRAQNLVCQEEVASRVIYIIFSSIYIIYVYRCRCGSRLMNLPSITRSVRCMTGAWSPTATTSSTTTPPTTTSTNTVRPAATAEVQGDADLLPSDCSKFWECSPSGPCLMECSTCDSGPMCPDGFLHFDCRLQATITKL